MGAEVCSFLKCVPARRLCLVCIRHFACKLGPGYTSHAWSQTPVTEKGEFSPLWERSDQIRASSSEMLSTSPVFTRLTHGVQMMFHNSKEDTVAYAVRGIFQPYHMLPRPFGLDPVSIYFSGLLIWPFPSQAEAILSYFQSK